MANSSMLVLPSITAPARLQLRDHRGVVGRDEVVEHARAAGGAHTRGAEDVLVRDRHAGEGPAVSGRERPVGRRGIAQRLLARHGDEGIERPAGCARCAPGTPRVSSTLEKRPRAQPGGELRRGRCDAVHSSRAHSITLGTRYRPAATGAHSAGRAAWRSSSVTASGRRRCDSPGSGCAMGATLAVSARSSCADEGENARQALQVDGKLGLAQLQSRQVGDALDLLAGQGHGSSGWGLAAECEK